MRVELAGELEKIAHRLIRFARVLRTPEVRIHPAEIGAYVEIQGDIRSQLEKLGTIVSKENYGG